MGSYKVIAPCAVVQAGKAWQVGDTVELDDDHAVALMKAGKIAPVSQGVTRTVKTLEGNFLPGPIVESATADTEHTPRRRRKTGDDNV